MSKDPRACFVALELQLNCFLTRMCVVIDWSLFGPHRVSLGVVAVVAFGNHGNHIPFIAGFASTCPSVISVGSSTHPLKYFYDRRVGPSVADYSARGPGYSNGQIKPDLLAPAGEQFMLYDSVYLVHSDISPCGLAKVCPLLPRAVEQVDMHRSQELRSPRHLWLGVLPC